MEFTIIFGLFAMGAYGLQVLLGMRQLKDFSLTYKEMRSKGRVAIGRRSGRITSGTIVMFALNKEDKVVAARKMQGVSVLARFRPMEEYVGQDIYYLDRYNPLVRKENRLLQLAIEDARDVFIRNEEGILQKEGKKSPFEKLGMGSKSLLNKLRNID